MSTIEWLAKGLCDTGKLAVENYILQYTEIEKSYNNKYSNNTSVFLIKQM